MTQRAIDSLIGTHGLHGTPHGYPTVLAGIDTGSNAVRCLIARFHDRKRFDILAHERVALRLGRAAFYDKKFDSKTISETIKTFETFAELMDRHLVEHCRAVATSAVRESRNGRELVQTIKQKTGINLEMIDSNEEARLVTLAVVRRADPGMEPWLLADLGGGSLELAFCEGALIKWVESYNNGSVRMLEQFGNVAKSPEEMRRLLSEYVSAIRIPHPLPRKPLKYYATGGNIEAIARLTDSPVIDGEACVSLSAISKLLDKLGRMTVNERISEYSLRADRADVILPATFVYLQVGKLINAEIVRVPFVGVKDGLLYDLAERFEPDENEVALDRYVEASSLSLGRKYQFDEAHGRQVSRLALEIFDQTQTIHGLRRDSRRLLLAAGLLHEIGEFVSRTGHHKHSMYLIKASGLMGLSADEVSVVANVARYHRKSPPKLQHSEFASLSREDRERVVKLAALLRLADSLDHDHAHLVTHVQAKLDGNKLILTADGVRSADMLLEQWSLSQKSDMFRAEYGLEVALQTAS